MSTIAERQVEPDIWRYLVGARNGWSRAKCFRLVQFLPELALVVVGAVLAITETDAVWIGAAAGGWIFVSRLVFRPLEHRYRRLAAVLQEHFDTQVFNLPWNAALCRQVAAEDAIRAAGHDAKKPEPWYPETATTGVQAVLACQRASVVWARRQHEAYGSLIACVTTALGLAGVLLALLLESSLDTYLTTLLLPTLPALLDGAELAKAHRRSAELRRELESVVQTAMSTARQRDARAIQDRIFGLRTVEPPVAESFYRLTRKRYEQDMTAAYKEE